MATQAPVRTDQQRSLRSRWPSSKARSTPGIKVLVAGIVGVVAAVALLWYRASIPAEPRPP